MCAEKQAGTGRERRGGWQWQGRCLVLTYVWVTWMAVFMDTLCAPDGRKADGEFV